MGLVAQTLPTGWWIFQRVFSPQSPHGCSVCPVTMNWTVCPVTSSLCPPCRVSSLSAADQSSTGLHISATSSYSSKSMTFLMTSPPMWIGSLETKSGTPQLCTNLQPSNLLLRLWTPFSLLPRPWPVKRAFLSSNQSRPSLKSNKQSLIN